MWCIYAVTVCMHVCSCNHVIAVYERCVYCMHFIHYTHVTSLSLLAAVSIWGKLKSMLTTVHCMRTTSINRTLSMFSCDVLFGLKHSSSNRQVV